MSSDAETGSTFAIAAPPRPADGGRNRRFGRGLRRLRPRARREIVLALALLLCFGFFRQVPAWNEYSRYDLVRALVEDGSLRIDPYHENTGDKAFLDGHYYSDKAPGTALLGAPVYVLLSLASTLTGAGPPDERSAVGALAFGVSGLATILLVLLLGRFLRPITGERWALAVSLGFGLGTMALPFATMYFGHAASSALLFGSFFLLWRWRADPMPWRAGLAGVLGGLAVVTEIPVALGVAVLAMYALWLGPRAFTLFVLGALPPAVVILGYNWLAFDSPFTLGYQLATVFGEQNSRGIVSIVWPSLSTTVDLLLGPRGLLRLSPWLIVAPLGILALRRARLRAELLVAVAMVTVFLTYNSGALNPFGGWTPGPRYLLPALPFAAILVAAAPRAIRPLVGFLIPISIAVAFIGTATMPNAPEAYRDPLNDLWLPRLLAGDLAETMVWLRWGVPGLLPLAILGLGVGLAAAAAWVASVRRAGTIGRSWALLAGGLAVLVVLAAAPIVPPLAFSPARFAAAERQLGDVSIGATGVDSIRTGDRPEMLVWAQVTNLGPPLAGTQLVVTIETPDGAPSWSGRLVGVDWAAGERQRLAVAWDTSGVAAGDYPVAVAVIASDAATVLASIDPAGTAVVR